jgi:uncharacterized protein (DUF983 family)
MRCRCPNCGKGHLFGKYLKVADQCEECGEEFHHHRADDLPAYLVIIVVGHVIVPAVLAVEVAYSPPYWLHALIWLPLTLVSSLGLLQPTKGAIVGLQWQTGMHGFEAARTRRLEQLAITASVTSEPALIGPAQQVVHSRHWSDNVKDDRALFGLSTDRAQKGTKHISDRCQP